MAFLTDGHQTLIRFLVSGSSGLSGVVLKEVEVQPPGIDGGGENDTTTMHNEVWRTRQPKKLKTMTPHSVVVSYDPAIYDDILSILQANGEIEVEFPDGSKLTYWGWLDTFVPQSLKEGEMPLADCTIICGNQNDDNEEVAPVYAPAT